MTSCVKYSVTYFFLRQFFFNISLKLVQIISKHKTNKNSETANKFTLHFSFQGYIAPWSGRFYSLWDTG